MSKTHYIKKSIDIPIYTGKLVIILTNESDRLPEHIQDNSIDLHAMSFVNDIKDNRIGFHVVFNFWGISKVYHGVIAHEIRHCVDLITEYHGIEMTKINEPAAYLTGWVADQVYLMLKENKLKPKLHG